MNLYKTSFGNMVEEIKQNKQLRLLHSNFAAPASSEMLKRASTAFFNGRESSILKFYKEMNGLQIVWENSKKINSEIEFQPLLFLNKEVSFDGVINFLPLEVILDQDTWKGTVWFEDDKDTQVNFLDEVISIDKIRKRLLPFDLFSTDMSMAIYGNETNDYVLLLQDYHIDFTNSLITYFDDYINLVLATKGLVQSRYKIFNALNGYRQPVHKTDQLIQKL